MRVTKTREEKCVINETYEFYVVAKNMFTNANNEFLYAIFVTIKI